ncbi:MAG: hypothetical protein KDJ17_05105 [Hyphomicrobiaceae bacterium]|nr:hypothetical protein [Hyphomicrobiaceae bacterium]
MIFAKNIQASLTGLLSMAVAIFAWASAAFGVEVEFKSREVRRDLIAFYDSRFEETPTVSRVHRLAEMPLNWLGYKLTYQDVNKPLPPITSLQHYRGVVSWLVEPLADSSSYLAWLDQASAQGLRLIVFGDVAPTGKSALDPTAQKIYQRIGVNMTDQFVGVTSERKPVSLDNAMIGFERPLDNALPPFPVATSASMATKVHLALDLPPEMGSASSSVVATSPGGGFVADGYAIFFDDTADRARWILNPFAFFRQALGDERFPIPDVTTLDGRRMYFSHIDGDGWNNISEIEGYRETQTVAADVIRQEIIEPYPDLPVSVGLIAGDTVPELGGMQQAGESATRLYALDQVEVASHTYTHPFVWSFYEHYDRAKELEMVDSATHPSPTLMDRMRGFLYRVAGKSESVDTRSRYIAGSADLPREYLKEPFNVKLETQEALKVSESFAPKGKKAAILLWSGDTEPFEEAIRETREAGVRNMNGGDTRLDAEYPSVFYVPPIARPVGSQRQIYAANSNENTYTNNWHGPYFGQLLLEETLANTDAPRRLKPFNLYYHMYSGEKAASLSALKHLLDLARAAAVIPVKASEYAGIADDFFAAQISQLDATTWSIANRGNMQTFRFDEAEGFDIDWLRSHGVMGLSRHNGALYIATDPAERDVTIVLRPLEPAAPGAATTEAARPLPSDGDDANPIYLIESRWQFEGLRRVSPCEVTAKAHGFGPGEMIWRALPSQSYEIEARRNGGAVERQTVSADAQGRLSFKLATGGLEPVAVGIKCHGG